MFAHRPQQLADPPTPSARRCLRLGGQLLCSSNAHGRMNSSCECAAGIGGDGGEPGRGVALDWDIADGAEVAANGHRLARIEGLLGIGMPEAAGGISRPHRAPHRLWTSSRPRHPGQRPLGVCVPSPRDPQQSRSSCGHRTTRQADVTLLRISLLRSCSQKSTGVLTPAASRPSYSATGTSPDASPEKISPLRCTRPAVCSTQRRERWTTRRPQPMWPRRCSAVWTSARILETVSCYWIADCLEGRYSGCRGDAGGHRDQVRWGRIARAASGRSSGARPDLTARQAGCGQISGCEAGRLEEGDLVARRAAGMSGCLSRPARRNRRTPPRRGRRRRPARSRWASAQAADTPAMPPPTTTASKERDAASIMRCEL